MRDDARNLFSLLVPVPSGNGPLFYAVKTGGPISHTAGTPIYRPKFLLPEVHHEGTAVFAFASKSLASTTVLDVVVALPDELCGFRSGRGGRCGQQWLGGDDGRSRDNRRRGYEWHSRNHGFGWNDRRGRDDGRCRHDRGGGNDRERRCDGRGGHDGRRRNDRIGGDPGWQRRQGRFSRGGRWPGR